MSETHEMKVSRATAEQVETLRKWFQELEELLDDPGKDVVDVGRFVQETFERRRIDGYDRILLGFETLVENVCDPKLSYLEFKPELLYAQQLVEMNRKCQHLRQYETVDAKGSVRCLMCEYQLRLNEIGGMKRALELGLPVFLGVEELIGGGVDELKS